MWTKLKNLPYIIIYIVGVILLLLAAVFYRQPLLSVILILMIVLPFLSVYAARCAIPRIEVDIIPEYREYELPGEVRLIVSVSNPTFLPLLNCRLTYRIENMYYPDGRDRELLFPAEARRNKKIYIPVTVESAGMLRLRAMKVEISDPLHMYTQYIVKSDMYDIPVMPKSNKPEKISLTKSESMEEDAIWAPDGELTMDLRQIRDYVPGDRLKDVHWLIAAKRDELPVKEYERAKELYYMLLPELTEDTLQDTLSTFYGLAQALLDMGETFRVAVYRDFEGIFDFITVEDEGNLKQSLYELYREQPVTDSAAYEKYKDMYPDSIGLVRIRGREITEG